MFSRFFLIHQEIAEETCLIAGKPKIGHAAASARVEAKRSDRKGLLQECAKPPFLHPIPFIGQARRQHLVG